MKKQLLIATAIFSVVGLAQIATAAPSGHSGAESGREDSGRGGKDRDADKLRAAGQGRTMTAESARATLKKLDTALRFEVPESAKLVSLASSDPHIARLLLGVEKAAEARESNHALLQKVLIALTFPQIAEASAKLHAAQGGGEPVSEGIENLMSLVQTATFDGDFGKAQVGSDGTTVVATPSQQLAVVLGYLEAVISVANSHPQMAANEVFAAAETRYLENPVRGQESAPIKIDPKLLRENCKATI
jgi:hypothetical protein